MRSLKHIRLAWWLLPLFWALRHLWWLAHPGPDWAESRERYDIGVDVQLKLRRPPHVRLCEGRVGLQAHVAARPRDRSARVPPQGGRHRAGGPPPGRGDAWGPPPGGRAHARGAGPDSLACLDFLPGHWRRLCASNLHGRANGEMKRRSRVVQVFPLVASPERLAGAVMCGQDEEWSRSGHFSGRVMPELSDESGARQAAAPTGEQLAAFRLVARGPSRRASSLRTSWRRRGIAG